MTWLKTLIRADVSRRGGRWALASLVAISAGCAPALSQTLEAHQTNKILIHDVQEKLTELGFDTGPLDGDYGRRTQEAFQQFVAAGGIDDSAFEAQMLALGVDLSGLENLDLQIDENGFVTVDGDAGDADGMLRRTTYDWKSFDLERYVVTGEGEEVFTLGLNYCDRHSAKQFTDCTTDRARIQVMDISSAVQHQLYTFEVNFARVSDTSDGKAIQVAEFQQSSGASFIHRETGERVTSAWRFGFYLEDERFIAVDNAVWDEPVNVGPRILDAAFPLRRNEWHRFDMEVRWSTQEDGFFRLWVDGKPIWERVGRNSTCIPEGQSSCEFIFKYGPYVSGLSGDYADMPREGNPIEFRYRNMAKVTGDTAIQAVIGEFRNDFKVRTERVGGASVEVPLRMTEQYPEEVGDSPFFSTLWEVVDTEAPAGKQEYLFRLAGPYDASTGVADYIHVFGLRDLDPEQQRNLATSCGQEAVHDGRAALLIRHEGDGNYVWQDPQCVIDNVGQQDSRILDFLWHRLPDLAGDMVTSNMAGTLRHDFLKAWIAGLASGEVTLSEN